MVRIRSRKGKTRGRSWDVKCVVKVEAEVGAVRGGMQCPWCRERMVSVGDAEVLLPLVEADGERVPRRGWRAWKAMKGYVVTWSFWAAKGVH